MTSSSVSIERSLIRQAHDTATAYRAPDLRGMLLASHTPSGVEKTVRCLRHVHDRPVLRSVARVSTVPGRLSARSPHGANCSASRQHARPRGTEPVYSVAASTLQVPPERSAHE